MRVSRKLGVLGALVATLSSSWAQLPQSPTVKPVVDAEPLPIDRGSSAVWQSLRKLQTRASLIMITAHPDDEDGGMLTYESRGQGAHVTLLTLNRGEGGQNVMSHDYFDAIGQVRTQELLQADRYYGVDQYWTRVADFGFAKTKEQALEEWGHDRVLYDVVRVIRMTRPLVVTSVFVGGPSDGHGQHQVAGVMAQEVFEAAGDPNVFPDQIKQGLLPWKPLKVYARVPSYAVSDKGMYDYATGKYTPVRFYDYVAKKWIEGPLPTTLEVTEGKFDPVLGQNYVQVSRAGLDKQKSQMGGVGYVAAGPMNSPYHRFGSVVQVSDKENSFFDGVDTSLMGIASLASGGDTAFLKDGLQQMDAAVKEATSKFNGQDGDAIAPALARGLKATRALIAQVEKSGLSADAKYNVNHELRIKEQQFSDAIAQALGLNLLAVVAPESDPKGRGMMFGGGMAETFRIAIPGQQFWVKVSAANQSSTPLRIAKLSLRGTGSEGWTIDTVEKASGEVAANEVANQRFKVTVPKDAKYTRPYFSRKTIEQPYYDIQDAQLLNRPTSDYPLVADLDVEYQGEPIHLSQVVQTAKRVTGAGMQLEPLLVGPAVSVEISPKAGVVPLTGSAMNLTVAVHNNVKGPAKGTLKLELPKGWTSTPADAPFSIAKDGEEQHINFRITPSKLEQKTYDITAVADYAGQKYTEGYSMVGYEGLRPYPLYSAATFSTRGVDVKVAKDLRIGYVEGTGDEVAKSLQDLGLKAEFLSSQDLASADLSKYDCIMLGVRAYAARPELATYNGRILDYVKNGGVVFVQYNTAQYDHDFGPYPYSLTSDPEKVVDETAKVQILEPSNPLFNWPNKITAADFDGWVEERGHSFMKNWDPKYQALTEVHDPDQDPQKGGLLYAPYGKGVYIYAAYALYRQLPEGVPGAFRLVANAVSLAHNPSVAKSAQATTTTKEAQ